MAMTREETWEQIVESGAAIGPMPEGIWDLSGADLSGAFLLGADLSRANLGGANLRLANLGEANLSQANLSQANLSRATLREANLSRATVRQANLSEANLSETRFGRADLSRANLTRANLSRANLNWGDLSGAVLLGANLSAADLGGANLSKSNLRLANLSGADLLGANLSGADLGGANLAKATFISANLGGANLRGAILRDVEFKRAVLVGTDLTEADISGACFDDADTSGRKIKGVICTHIIREGNKIYFQPGEFEKKYTASERVFDIVLKGPLSDLTLLAGQIIENEINNAAEEPAVKLKGQELISDDETMLRFISFVDADKHAQIREAALAVQTGQTAPLSLPDIHAEIPAAEGMDGEPLGELETADHSGSATKVKLSLFLLSLESEFNKAQLEDIISAARRKVSSFTSFARKTIRDHIHFK